MTTVYHYFLVVIIDHFLLLIINDMEIEIKVGLIFILIVILIIWIFLIHVFNSVTVEAHKPYQKLHSLIESEKIKISLKFKIIDIIERLSGPIIGFYCLNGCAFIHYELYLYFSSIISNFILILGT